MEASYGPNVYVSALVIRGRVGPAASGAGATLQHLADRLGWKPGGAGAETAPAPTGLVDLGKPAFRLGLAQVRVGWSGYALQVKVEPDKSLYPVRATVPVTITVTDPSGQPVAGTEVALAAVDEGLLELRANRSWDLLAAMMQRRPEEVQTSTAQGEVIGKRHFGKKAAAPGGGGGSATARELFDTLLLWQGRVTLDGQGRARVMVPLNDALSSFRIEAVASAGVARFGSGSATVRTSQDLMLFAGVSPFVREGDTYRAMFTVRNAGQRTLDVEVVPRYKVLAGDAGNGQSRDLPPRRLTLAAGAAQTVAFDATAPVGSRRVEWTVQARELHGAAGPGAQDKLVVSQRVGSAYPVRVYQQTLLQLEPGHAQSFPVELPPGALPGRGGVEVRLARSLGGDTAALREWADRYPYTCLEQRASTAVIDEDRAAWDRVMQSLPAHLDGDGLARYFPVSWLPGDDGLTAYLLAISEQAGYPLPEGARGRMIEGLSAFVQGRISRWGSLPTADLAIRKMAAIEALARQDAARPEMLDAIDIAPNLWPSSAVIDWLSVLARMPTIPDRDARREQARQILRARLAYSGTTLLFSTEKSDYLWWLMVSPDRNATRALLLAADDPAFADDAGRMARGALARQLQGHWNTTVANAWGVLALRRFQARFEKDPVTGTTQASLGSAALPLDWTAAVSRPGNDPTLGTPIGDGPEHLFEWQPAPATLSLTHQGTGRPWALVAAKAALPLTEPLFAGYTVKRTVSAVEQKHPGQYLRGDVLRIHLDIEAQQDMTWVAVSDPVPAGATVLGTGLGGDSALMTRGETQARWGPAFEERTFEGYRAYYRYLPKGHLAVEYAVRLNNAGRFEMPATRVEAMYAPEIYGESPVAPMEIEE